MKDFFSKVTLFCAIVSTVFIIFGLWSFLDLSFGNSQQSSSKEVAPLRLKLTYQPNHPNPVLEDLLNSIVWKKYLVVVFVPFPDQQELLLNWRAAYEKHQEKPTIEFLVLGLHVETVAFAKEEQMNAIHVKNLIDGIGEQQLTSPGFINQVITKSIAALLKYYKHQIILSDVRSVFLKPNMILFFEHLFEVLKQNVLVSSDIWRDGNFQDCCSVFRPSNVSLLLLEKSAETSRMIGIYKRIRQMPPDYRIKVHFFDQILFRNEKSPLVGPKSNYESKPWFFYTTQQVSSGETSEILKKAGHWYIY